MILALVCYGKMLAQDTTTNIRGMTVNLDEVVVAAQRVGFDVNSFIKRVEDDTTFYRAFKNLHRVGFTASNDIRVYDKDRSAIKASLLSKTRQLINGNCRHMETLSEKTTGNFYTKDHGYNYYTAALYANLFFTQGTVCGEEAVTGSKSSLDKHKGQLKQLIFNPGKPIKGVPIVGGKVAIFDPAVQRLYDFSIIAATYHDSISCYVFTARAKKDLGLFDRGDIVIDELITYFNKENFEIVSRKYSLSYKTVLFDFKVQMNVEMTKVNDLLIPLLVTYDGTWDVAFKKRETASFIARFGNFNQ
ncbi:hypothetical protein DCM91_02385 [Chitinophaga costaii]|nr:hypothetical protein DCM91_02385 [Chitinophaga costaii]